MIRAILLLCASYCVLASPTAGDRCKITDRACMVKVTNTIYKWFFNKENHLNPTHHDVIEAKIENLHYKLTDVIVDGFDNCTITDSSMDIENVHFEVTLICPRITLEGKYTLSGKLFDLPLEGSGNFRIESGKYRINHHMTIELSGTDTKTQIQIGNNTCDGEPLEKVSFKFENINKGNKDLAEAVGKYVDENWKSVVEKVQDPFLRAQVDKITVLANKYFKTSYLQRSLIL